jgi:hypothetical protein
VLQDEGRIQGERLAPLLRTEAGQPRSYAAVPVSALRRIGADVIAVAGRTGDQIKTEFKAQGDFTPFGTDKSIAELGETCR